VTVLCFRRRKKEEGRRKKEEGRRKKEEGRRKKEEGRRKKEEGRRNLLVTRLCLVMQIRRLCLL
jgi:hypothetical protein